VGQVAARWHEAADGVFVRRYAVYDQSIGVVVGDDGVLLVDTRSTHRQAEELRRDVAGLTALPVVAGVGPAQHRDRFCGSAGADFRTPAGS
jgi:alkyl sulfatase BDS1-like metallo-beta-lactamase superfamily hydrolase